MTAERKNWKPAHQGYTVLINRQPMKTFIYYHCLPLGVHQKTSVFLCLCTFIIKCLLLHYFLVKGIYFFKPLLASNPIVPLSNYKNQMSVSFTSVSDHYPYPQFSFYTLPFLTFCTPIMHSCLGLLEHSLAEGLLLVILPISHSSLYMPC